jgi:hypothetical protein
MGTAPFHIRMPDFNIVHDAQNITLLYAKEEGCGVEHKEPNRKNTIETTEIGEAYDVWPELVFSHILVPHTEIKENAMSTKLLFCRDAFVL